MPRKDPKPTIKDIDDINELSHIAENICIALDQLRYRRNVCIDSAEKWYYYKKAGFIDLVISKFRRYNNADHLENLLGYGALKETELLLDKLKKYGNETH